MSELKEGTVYLIRSMYNTKFHYEGTFSKYDTNDSNQLSIFKDVSMYSKNYNYCLGTYPKAQFYNNEPYKYYHAEKVKNGQKSIQNMEKRALDLVLKRLVNENFEWL